MEPIDEAPERRVKERLRRYSDLLDEIDMQERRLDQMRALPAPRPSKSATGLLPSPGKAARLRKNAPVGAALRPWVGFRVCFTR